jgi:acyl-CoA reductase-like NAD-dependent aldehyde dehydrogenase
MKASDLFVKCLENEGVMPYGGVKDSGLGREGPKYAILDLMEPRILVLDHT